MYICIYVTSYTRRPYSLSPFSPFHYVGLIKHTRPFLNKVSKAKAAKLVRALMDLFLDMEVKTGKEVVTCRVMIMVVSTDDLVTRDSAGGAEYTGPAIV